MPVYRWSQTAGSNAGADPGINWAEGQSPSSINDSGRAMMAATAQYRDDISGATVTTGTSAAYALSTFSNFTSAAFMANQIVAFTPHVTNAAGPVTMTVDSQANIPLRSSPGKELPAGVLIQGTPYVCVYNLTDGALYLRSFYGASPYLIPLAAGMDYWASTAPNSSFAFPIGQAISRTTYATLFALFGTTYGGGDGSTTFNIPDKTGRASVMKEAAASRLTATYFGGNSANMGAVGGGESDTLITANLPPYTPAGSVAGSSFSYQNTLQAAGGTQNFVNVIAAGSGGPNVVNLPAPALTLSPQGGISTPIRTVQPTIVCNYIIRII